MKKALLPLSLLFLNINTAQACNPVEGPYLSLMGHGSTARAVTFPWVTSFAGIGSSLTNAQLTYKYRIGGGGSIALGYRCNQYRGELQFLFNTNSLDKVTLDTYNYSITKDINNDGYRIKGQTNMFGGFINGYIDLYSGDPDVTFVPYVGLGFGAGKVTHHIRYYYQDIEISNTYSRTNNTAGAVQFILGFNYFLNDFTSFGIDYRFLTTNRVSTFDNRLQLNMLNFRLNYTFDWSN